MTGASEGAAWLAAAAEPAIVDLLHEARSRLDREVARRSPACWSSGRCCQFERSGHLLYTTGLEAAMTLSRMERWPTVVEIERAIDGGVCPFLHEHRCGIHTLRPIGCRLYYCDASARPWMESLAERLQDRVRQIHRTWGIPYRYAEWRALLREIVADRAGAP